MTFRPHATSTITWAAPGTPVLHPGREAEIWLAGRAGGYGKCAIDILHQVETLAQAGENCETAILTAIRDALNSALMQKATSTMITEVDD